MGQSKFEYTIRLYVADVTNKPFEPSTVATMKSIEFTPLVERIIDLDSDFIVLVILKKQMGIFYKQNPASLS